MKGEYRYIPPRPPLWFTLAWIGGLGALVGFLTARGDFSLMLPFMALGAVGFLGLAYVCSTFLPVKFLAGIVGFTTLFVFGFIFFGLGYALLVGILGLVAGRGAIWLSTGAYRENLAPYASSRQVLWFYTFRFLCGLIFLFLITPILIVIPLSFNVEPYFSFTPKMLALNPEAFSLRWYADIFRNGMAAPDAIVGWWSDMWNNAQWIRSVRNSFFIGICATVFATAIGTLAAIGLARSEMPYRRPIMALLISPMIVPLVIIASGMFFFFSDVGIAKSYVCLLYTSDAADD